MDAEPKSDAATAGCAKSASPRLLDRVRAAVRLRHYGFRTEECYLARIRRFILFHNKRHPLEMGAAEINAFLTDLAVRGHVSASTQNQAFSAILFLYQKVLEVDPGRIEGVIRAKRPQRLPVVLSPEEVRRTLGEMDGTCRLIALLLYGADLRLIESLRLRVQDWYEGESDWVRGAAYPRDPKGIFGIATRGRVINLRRWRGVSVVRDRLRRARDFKVIGCAGARCVGIERAA